MSLDLREMSRRVVVSTHKDGVGRVWNSDASDTTSSTANRVVKKTCVFTGKSMSCASFRARRDVSQFGKSSQRV